MAPKGENKQATDVFKLTLLLFMLQSNVQIVLAIQFRDLGEIKHELIQSELNVLWKLLHYHMGMNQQVLITIPPTV